MNLGAHMSIAGGLHLACERGRDFGCDVIQMFVKNERQWKGRELEEEAVAEFKAAQKANRIRTAFAHDTYLINMASPVSRSPSRTTGPPCPHPAAAVPCVSPSIGGSNTAKALLALMSGRRTVTPCRRASSTRDCGE